MKTIENHNYPAFITETVKTPLRFIVDLQEQNHYELTKKGFRIWDYTPDKEKVLYLFPKDYYDLIPFGAEVIDINFNKHFFNKENPKTQKTTKYNCLEFGILKSVTSF